MISKFKPGDYVDLTHVADSTGYLKSNSWTSSIPEYLLRHGEVTCVPNISGRYIGRVIKEIVLNNRNAVIVRFPTSFNKNYNRAYTQIGFYNDGNLFPTFYKTTIIDTADDPICKAIGPLEDNETIINNNLKQKEDGRSIKCIKVQRITPTITAGKRLVGVKLSGKASKATVTVGQISYRAISGE